MLKLLQPTWNPAGLVAAFAALVLLTGSSRPEKTPIDPIPAPVDELVLPVQGLPEGMAVYTETIPSTDISFEMVPIPGGTYLMGSAEDEEGFTEDEGPQHEVVVGPFWMGQCEVTWEEYDQFAFSYDLASKVRRNVDLNAQPENEQRADAVTRPTAPYADETFGYGRDGRPAICITHHAAMEYCRWLSAKTGQTYRLPTEAEWEYAARAGTTTPYFFGEDTEDIDDYAWYFDNAGEPMPVGQLKPNPWGLKDILGNVSEWCLDQYAPDVYATRVEADKPVVRPVLLPDFHEYPYVARGGSFDDFPENLRAGERRASNRDWSMRDPQRPQSIWWHTDAIFVGFRVVRPYQEQEELKKLTSQVVKGKDTESGFEIFEDY